MRFSARNLEASMYPMWFTSMIGKRVDPSLKLGVEFSVVGSRPGLDCTSSSELVVWGMSLAIVLGLGRRLEGSVSVKMHGIRYVYVFRIFFCAPLLFIY